MYHLQSAPCGAAAAPNEGRSDGKPSMGAPADWFTGTVWADGQVPVAGRALRQAHPELESSSFVTSGVTPEPPAPEPPARNPVAASGPVREDYAPIPIEEPSPDDEPLEVTVSPVQLEMTAYVIPECVLNMY